MWCNSIASGVIGNFETTPIVVDGILWVAVAVQTFVLIEEMLGVRERREPESVA